MPAQARVLRTILNKHPYTLWQNLQQGIVVAVNEGANGWPRSFITGEAGGPAAPALGSGGHRH